MKNLLNALIIIMFSLTSYVSYAATGDPNQPLYYVIEEPFTINFLRQSDEQARYLQIKVALKSSDPTLLSSAESNLPMIQDTLRTLFAEQDMQTIKNLEGRNQLQQEAYERIKALFEEETGNSNLEAIYFTTFLWQ